MTLEKWLVLPVAVHFFMTALIGVLTGRARFSAVRSGLIKREQIINNTQAWPADVLKLGNNFTNQFQAPMMWYALTAFVLVTRTVDLALVLMSWLFLASRIWHAAIHTGANRLPQRFYAFLAGFGVLIAMWSWFAIRFFVMG